MEIGSSPQQSAELPSTNTSQAVPGTIRGDFSADTPLYATLKKRPIKTLVHASGNEKEIQKIQ